MVNTNSELNNNKALNTYRLMGIFSQFEISEEIKDVLSERLSGDKLFNLFCNKYSKLHGKTKQVKKEFLLVLAYSMKDNFTISDYTNFQQQFDDASSIETAKGRLDIWEKISNVTPDGTVKDMISVPFFDGSSLIKNITFSIAEYTNIMNVKDIVDTIESNGHIELNSIIKSATDNKKLFYAYMSEMHKKEDSFIHNYIPKGHPITEVDVDRNFDNLLKELKITKVLYEKLSPYNKEVAFFCETNDLINIINKSVFYLRLNKDNLLNEKDQQFQPKVFAHYHHRAGVEIMKKCLNGEYEKLDDFLQNIPQNTRKSFLDHVNKNYNDHVQIIHDFYYSQTKKNINKTSSIKPIIDFFSIKNSLTHANNHLLSLKDYILSDINMEFSNLKNIEQIENNINLLIHNLKIYNDKVSTYKENSKLLNQAISGNFKYSLPTKLQMSEIVDMDGKPIKEKSFNDLFNETSNLYQNLLIGKSFLKNERQVNLLMLSKANFETFKASGRFEEFVLTTNNKIKMMMEENIDDKKKMVLKGISEQLRYLMNKNNGLSENDLLGISANSIGVALTVKSLGADITSFKVIDSTSNLLTTVKEMVLNKNIYHNIDNTFVEIQEENKGIIKGMWNTKRYIERENNKISINKTNKPNQITQVERVRAAAKNYLENYNDKKIDEDVNNQVKKNKK